MNPEDLAAARFQEVAKARERVARVDAALATSHDQREQLRTRVTAAAVLDREQLAAALIDSKPEPPSEAAKVKAELEREAQRTEALVLAAEKARGAIPQLVAENRNGWLRRAEQELGKAHRRYLEAIAELEAAREALNNEATLIGWLRNGTASEAATDSLGGRSGMDASGRGVVSFGQTLEVLREDVQDLMAYASPDDKPPTGEPRRELAWTSKGW
jgi:hypothetical protein